MRKKIRHLIYFPFFAGQHIAKCCILKPRDHREEDGSMRVQIQIPPQLWNRLCQAAHREHRYPRQHIEFLIAHALSKEENRAALYDPASMEEAHSQEVGCEC